MDNSLWIFDYDQTLMPTFITDIINNNYFNKIDEVNVNYICIVLINIIIIINYIITELNGRIIILTASIDPWVSTSLKKIDNIIKYNKHLINYNIIKNHVIQYDYNKIKNILNTDDFFSQYIHKFIKSIVYVHNIEYNILGINERYNKKNSLLYILHNHDMYKNIIILGDAYDNERKHAINYSTNNKNLYIKFIQFYNTNDIIIKIHEQHLLFNNLRHICHIKNSVIYDID
jgi:hypothetical protein